MMAPTQDFDVGSCYVNPNGNQSEDLKTTQQSQHTALNSSTQDQSSFQHRHLNIENSQYSTQDSFDAHSNNRSLFIDQSRLVDCSQDFSNQSAAKEEAENLRKSDTRRPADSVENGRPPLNLLAPENDSSRDSSKAPPQNQSNLAVHVDDKQNEVDQISPVPTSREQQHADYTRTPLEEPMVDGEKISPIVAERTNSVGLHGEHIMEPPFGELSPRETPTASTGASKQVQDVSPSPTSQRPVEVTSTPIPLNRDASEKNATEPSALDKLKSLANRTDNLVLSQLQSHGDQGQNLGAQDQRREDRRLSCQDSECSSDSEDRFQIWQWCFAENNFNNFTKYNSVPFVSLTFYL